MERIYINAVWQYAFICRDKACFVSKQKRSIAMQKYKSATQRKLNSNTVVWQRKKSFKNLSKKDSVSSENQLVLILFATAAAFSSSFRTTSALRPASTTTISHRFFLTFFDLCFVFAEPFLEFVHCCGLIKKIKRYSTQ